MNNQKSDFGGCFIPLGLAFLIVTILIVTVWIEYRIKKIEQRLEITPPDFVDFALNPKKYSDAKRP